jgi:hypothetical protein
MTALLVDCYCGSTGNSWFFLTADYAFGHSLEKGLMVHDLLLVQVKKPEESKYPWDYYQVLTHIPGDQAFGPPNPACPLVKG